MIGRPPEGQAAARRARLAGASAASLHGAISVSTLAEHGLHESVRHRLVVDGLLRRADGDVFVVTGTESEGSYEQRCATALLAAGTDAMLAREAAARLCSLDGYAPRRRSSHGALIHEQQVVANRPPSVNVPRSSGRRGPGIRRVEPFDGGRTILGLRVTGIDQTLIELQAGLPTVPSPGGHRLDALDQVEPALECTLHNELTTIERVVSALESVGPGHRGAIVLRAVLARRPVGAPPTEIWMERRTIQVLRVEGCTDAERQVELFDRHARRVGRVDLLIGRLVIECDSKEFHPDLEADRRRWATLQANGYLVLPVTFRALEFQTTDLIRTVRDLLAKLMPKGQCTSEC